MEQAFWTVFWLVIGSVIGALTQYYLNKRTFEFQKRNAKKILETEIELNLDALGEFENRLSYLRERVAANQVGSSNLFVTLENFDYSALGPLVNSGHFHTILGKDRVKDYFEFVRFFRNSNAETLNSKLKIDHELGRSLDTLDEYQARAKELEGKLEKIKTYLQR
ncbi:hypothetical protein [Thioclava sp. JE_KL1]|uniref:hypothetical protein n=1 Tax=Thioclava sp. JE_KL1 TaxID=2651187 RepID=UPI00128D183B|nr:hypothetical protein [Thioclava sp. JE_KL1]MPQ92472.1 hypothetical protein [Thioclava sp. JE_KL1]